MSSAKKTQTKKNCKIDFPGGRSLKLKDYKVVAFKTSKGNVERYRLAGVKEDGTRVSRLLSAADAKKLARGRMSHQKVHKSKKCAKCGHSKCRCEKKRSSSVTRKPKTHRKSKVAHIRCKSAPVKGTRKTTKKTGKVGRPKSATKKRKVGRPRKTE